MHFLRFSVRQALQGLWRNRVMNIAATVTMVLMLILLSTLVILISGRGGRSGLHRIARSRCGPSSTTACGRSRVHRVPAAPGRPCRRWPPSPTSARSRPWPTSRPRARSRARRTSATSTPTSTPSRPTSPSSWRTPASRAQVTALLESETGLVRTVLGQQSGIDRLVNLTALLRNLGAIVLGLRGPHGAAHRHQQHPHGAHVSRRGDRDHASRGGLGPLRALALHLRGRLHRPGRRASSRCCSCSSPRGPSATSPARSPARCRSASTAR